MNQFSTNKSCACHQAIPGKNDKKSTSKIRLTAKVIPSAMMSIFIAFFPKCPICWAAYMSMFSSIGLARLPYMSWLLPVLMILLGIHVVILYQRRVKTGYLPFLLSLAGAFGMLLVKTIFVSENWLLVVAMSLIIIGSLLNSFLSFKLNMLS